MRFYPLPFSLFFLVISSIEILIPLHARAHRTRVINTSGVLDDFIREPNDKNLYRLRNSCSQTPLHGKNLELQLKSLRELTRTTQSVRASLVIVECGLEGEQADDWNFFLGNDVLLETPDVLVAALAREASGDSFLSSMIEAAGTGDRSLFSNCDKKCFPKVDSVYGKKSDAIEGVHPKNPLEIEVQKKLLKQITLAQKKWHERLSSSAPQ